MPGKKSREQLLQGYMDEQHDEIYDIKKLIVIDNIPKVDPVKATKLVAVLNKKIKDNVKAEPRELELVRDEAGCTLGYCFVEFESEEVAKKAVTVLNGHRLDKAHTFKANTFPEYERLMKVNDVYEEPKVKDHIKCIDENLHEYVCDTVIDRDGNESSLAREQYLIRYTGDSEGVKQGGSMDLEIFCHDYQIAQDADIKNIQLQVKKKSDWTGPWVQWSTHGTYLVTFKPDQGIYLWGGKDWSQLGRFMHADVQAIEFSSNDKYMMTWCRKNELHIWDVTQGKKLRRFQALQTQEVNLPHKLFKWSPDERFLLRLSPEHAGHIFIHDMQDNLRLVMPDPEKATSIHVEGLKCETCDLYTGKQVAPPVEWSPTDNLIAYWIPERGNAPAKVAVVEVIVKKREGDKDLVTFETRAERNIFGVHRIWMNWHAQGDFLACKVEREKRGPQGKTIVSAYEMFRVRGGKKEWAVETLEINDQVVAFDWEPKGHRFALVHGPRAQDHAVSFYTMGGVKSGHLKLIRKLEKKEVNGVYWSPRGHHAVLAGTEQPFNGKLVEFWDVDALEKSTASSKVAPLMSTEHHMLTNVIWDASGRYVTTYVQKYMVQSMTQEHGYRIYTFQGRLILEKKRKNLWQFLWRPRPPSLLGDKEFKHLKKTKETWEEKYRQQDDYEKNRSRIEEEQKRREKTNTFLKRKAAIQMAQEGMLEERQRLWSQSGANFWKEGRGGYTWRTETVDELVKKEEKLIVQDN